MQITPEAMPRRNPYAPDEPEDDDEQEPALKWFFSSGGWLASMRSIMLTMLIATAASIVVVSVAGVWPPFAAVESHSMEPNLQKNDVLVITAPNRFAPPQADLNGIVTASAADQSHESFGQRGSVILYTPPDRTGPPVVHRVKFHVEKGENWFKKANRQAVNADSCERIAHCPASHAGYITKGDNNRLYDQTGGVAPVVKPSWIRGRVEYRIPLAGRLRVMLT